MLSFRKQFKLEKRESRGDQPCGFFASVSVSTQQKSEKFEFPILFVNTQRQQARNPYISPPLAHIRELILL
jgi:hypothetical protein